MKTKLDERQLINRYKIGFQSFGLTLFLLIIDTLVQDVFYITWASHFTRSFILFYFMIIYFEIRCILSDSYFAEHDSRSIRNIMIFSFLGGAFIGISIIAQTIKGRFFIIENNMLSDKTVTVVTAIWMLAVPLCYFLKEWQDRKDDF